jgi:phospholipid/cholesterol/gamma-HCH transport system substrate-binding protein
METRANFILIGAFALAGFLGLIGFFLWFANLQLDRQFAYYDVDFTTVSGLSEASDVRFAGLPVGQVVDVRLSPERDGRVRVRVEVDADTPVRTDSIATIEAQGVTGVSFVGISAGTQDAPLLTAASDSDVPRIEAGQSVLQSLSENAPEILAETLEVVRNLQTLLGGDNQARVETILSNVEQASASFSDALTDFSEVSDTVSRFAREIDTFNALLSDLSDDAAGVLETAESTLGAIEALSQDARGIVAEGAQTLAQVETTMGTADRYIADTLAPATDQLGASVAEIEARVTALALQADELAATYTDAGVAASARLDEARETLAATNALIARIEDTAGSVDTAVRRFDGLMVDGAEPLIAELRVATTEATAVLRTIGETAETDLPAILGDIRATAETAAEVVRSVGTDLSGASSRLDGLAQSAGDTLTDARDTFANANATLAAINEALATGDRALAAAERAFVGADRVMNDDIAGIVAGLETTLDALESAIGSVADQIPGVADDLRAASRSAETAFAELAGTVDATSPAVRNFAATALPQFSRLATETRALIDNLDTLIEQISRDPSRFFLDPRTPEYRR